jgi:hypothetical protein
VQSSLFAYTNVMRFKDFITRQRVGVLIIGIVAFLASLLAAHVDGPTTLAGALFIDLAASATTVVFTALIIDYLSVREESNKTQSAAGLAEDEINATCFRIRWRMARLFGLERHLTGIREHISSREEVRDYLEEVRGEVDEHLSSYDMLDKDTPLDSTQLQRYLERLQTARTELEQTLMLYQYAMGYSLRERVLNLRSELQIADNILGFIDFSDDLNDANISLIRILSQSIYDGIEEVLGHDSRTAVGVPIHAKESRLA